MIDPRPYTYEYRKPRLANPTYRSSNMYDSLYHLRFPSKSEFIQPRQTHHNAHQQPSFKLPSKNQSDLHNNPERRNPQQFQPPNNLLSARQQSMDMKERYAPQIMARNSSVNRHMMDRSDSRQFNNPPNNGVHSQLSNYGQNLMKSSQFNRFQVYEKQQKGFNIINCQPKQMSSSLRVFPKLTLEDKLIEKGRYGPK